MTGPFIPSTRVVGYAYDAGHHCLGCGASADMNLTGALDAEGNEVGTIFSGEVAAISCDDCLHSFCGLCGALIESGSCVRCHAVPGELP